MAKILDIPILAFFKDFSSNFSHPTKKPTFIQNSQKISPLKNASVPNTKLRREKHPFPRSTHWQFPQFIPSPPLTHFLAHQF